MELAAQVERLALLITRMTGWDEKAILGMNLRRLARGLNQLQEGKREE